MKLQAVVDFLLNQVAELPFGEKKNQPQMCFTLIFFSRK